MIGPQDAGNLAEGSRFSLSLSQLGEGWDGHVRVVSSRPCLWSAGRWSLARCCPSIISLCDVLEAGGEEEEQSRIGRGCSSYYTKYTDQAGADADADDREHRPLPPPKKEVRYIIIIILVV